MRSFRSLIPGWGRLFATHLFTKKMIFVQADDVSGERVSPVWRTFYLAALFEKDEQRVGQRILEAKKALVVRARDLFQMAGDHLQEQTAIEEAFQALHTLELVRGPRVSRGAN